MTTEGCQELSRTRRTAPNVRAALLPNSTPVPNFFFDTVMPHVPHASFKVLLFIWRKTIGWQKESDLVSLSQIQRGAGVCRDVAIAAAQFWVRIGLCRKKRGAGYRGVNEYTVIPDFDKEEATKMIGALVDQHDQSDVPSITGQITRSSIVDRTDTQKAPVSKKRAKQKATSFTSEGQHDAKFHQIPRI